MFQSDRTFLFTSMELMHFSVATRRRMQDTTVAGVGGHRWKRVKPAAEGSTQHVHCLDGIFLFCFDAQRKTTGDGGEGEALMAQLTFSAWLFPLVSRAASVMNRKGSHVKTIHLQLLELQCRAHTHIHARTHTHTRGLDPSPKADF